MSNMSTMKTASKDDPLDLPTAPLKLIYLDACGAFGLVVLTTAVIVLLLALGVKTKPGADRAFIWQFLAVMVAIGVAFLGLGIRRWSRRRVTHGTVISVTTMSGYKRQDIAVVEASFTTKHLQRQGVGRGSSARYRKLRPGDQVMVYVSDKPPYECIAITPMPVESGF